VAVAHRSASRSPQAQVDQGLVDGNPASAENAATLGTRCNGLTVPPALMARAEEGLHSVDGGGSASPGRERE
jgi:hypothetical protein